MYMISVITITNKTNTNIIENIFNNYNNQSYPNKELILIVNKDENLRKYVDKSKEMNIKNCKIFGLHPFISLGECLNYTINKMSGEYWAKMDDDDIYGINYLTEAHFNIINTKADLIGKNSVIIHDKNTKTLYDVNGKKNVFVDFVRGPTFFCHKDLFNSFRFQKLNKGEDTQFIKDLVNAKRKIYSTSERNFMYIRDNTLNQTSTTPLKKYLGSKYKILSTSK